jgi:hypothetical protein
MIWRGRSGDYQGGEPPAAEAGPGEGSGPLGSRIESVLEAAERAANGIKQDAEEWARRYLEESRRKADDIASERVQELSNLTETLMNRARAVAQQSDALLAALDDAGRRLVNTARQGGNASAPDPYGQQVQAPPVPQAPPPQQPPPPVPQETPPPPQAQAAPPPVAAPPAPPMPQQAPPPPPPAPAAVPGPPPVPPPAPRAPAPAPPPPAPQPPPVAAGGGVADSRVSEGARLLATQMAVAGSTRDEIAWRLREEFGIHDATAILDEIGL